MKNCYFVRYRFYNVNNVIIFHGQGQYLNWLDVMETQFFNQFKIIEIIPFYL